MFCKQCGYSLPDTSRFCPMCGTDNAPAPAQQAPPAVPVTASPPAPAAYPPAAAYSAAPSAPPVPAHAAPAGAPKPSPLLLSILALILNVPAGIASLLLRARVSSLCAAGDNAAALKHRTAALAWSVVGLAAGAFSIALFVVRFFILK